MNRLVHIPVLITSVLIKAKADLMQCKLCPNALHVCFKCAEQLVWSNLKSRAALKSSEVTADIIQICYMIPSSRNTITWFLKHQDSTEKMYDIKYR